MAVEVRAMKVIGNFLYAVVANKAYKINSALVRTPLGILTTSEGPAWIAGDGTNLCFCDVEHGYTYKGTTWAEIAFPDDFAPSSLTFLDGYFIVSRKDTERFYVSSDPGYDPDAWEALRYASAAGDPDDLVCVYSLNRELWLLGKYSTEIWQNTGADFPFERYLGGFVNVGCRSARSVAASPTQLFWLDDDLRVRTGVGVQSQVLSTMQIDYQISLLSDWDEAVGFFYMMDGHEFYQLTIANKTLCYDATTGYWHTRASGILDQRHPAQCYAWFNDLHLVGHYDNGNIYEWDMDTYTNDGAMLRRIRSAQTVHNDRKRVFNAALDVEFEAGVGNAACVNPVAILEWSDDDGHTWSAEYTASIGAAGAYETRAIWRRLGNARGRVYKVTVEDPVKTVIIGAHLEGSPGTS